MCDVATTPEEFEKHEPRASDLRILGVFQHPKWFISLYTKETCDLLLLYNSEDARFSTSLPV